MRDLATLHQEIVNLEQKYGRENIHWSESYDWLLIDNFILPPRITKRQTRIAVLLPESYGNGAPLIDSFIEPGLQAWGNNGRPMSISHYFKEYLHSEQDLSFGSRSFWSRKGYWWLCLQDLSRSNSSPTTLIRQYLNHVYIFFNEPHREWGNTFDAYAKSAR